MRPFLRAILRFKLLIILLAVTIVVGGAWSATKLRQQLFPDISFPIAFIDVEAPGVPPSVIDDQVARPLAKSVEHVDGIRNLTTVASDGSVNIYGELELGVDVEDTTAKILQTMRGVDLPAGVGEPHEQGSFTEQPVLISAIVTEGTDIAELTKRVERLKADLLEVDGVAKVEVPGALREQVQVQLKPEALAAGLTPAYVLDALGEGAAEKDVAALETTKLPEPVDVPDGFTYSNAQGTRSGTNRFDTVGGIATIRKTLDPGAGFAIANGERSIAIRVQRRQDANEVDVVDEAQAIIKRFDKANADLQVVTLSENATGVKASIRGLLIEGILGAFGAVLVIFLFLRSGRGTLVAAVSIPTSLVFGLLVGYWLDLTLDIITLAGLTIAIGRVIDDAIVVIENISKHIERGESIDDAVINGTAEVATAIMASTAATVAVFLPLGFLGGFISSLFRSFSIIVAVSLAASLLVAITIVPVLAQLMFRKAAREHTMHAHEKGRLERWVRPATAFGLRHRALTVGIAVLSVAATAGLVVSGAIPTQFLPDSSVQQVYGTVTLPPGLSEDAARAQLEDLSKVLDDTKGVVDWQYSFGAETFFSDHSAGAGAVTFVANLEHDVDGAPIVKAIRKAGSRAYPDHFAVQQLENGPPAGTFQANIKTKDPDELRSATETLVKFLKRRDDLSEVSGSQGAATLPQLAVEPRLGLEVDIAALRRAVAAYASPAIDESGNGASIAVLPPSAAGGDAGGPLTGAPDEAATGRVRGGELSGDGGSQSRGDFDPIAALASLPAVPLGEKGASNSPDSATIGDLADLSIEPRLAFVSRTQGRLVTTVDARIEGKDTAGITKDIRADIKRLERSGDLGKVEIDYEGEQAFVNQMFADLGKAVVIAIILVLLVLFFAFRSLLQPFAMLAPVLFSTFGAFMALAITGNALGLPAMIGQLLLIGIVVSNAILLVDAVVRMRKRGLTAHQALQQGAVLRVRPVLMTAFATMAALLPLAIGVSGEGGIISKSLGVVVIGGLALATFGTLVIVPAAYSLIARGKREERRRLDGDALLRRDGAEGSAEKPADDRPPVGVE